MLESTAKLVALLDHSDGDPTATVSSRLLPTNAVAFVRKEDRGARVHAQERPGIDERITSTNGYYRQQQQH